MKDEALKDMRRFVDESQQSLNAALANLDRLGGRAEITVDIHREVIKHRRERGGG